MIEILGVNEGKEFEAAEHVRKQILAVWPDLAQNRDDHVKITRERAPDLPAFGFVGRHPRYADIGNGEACRHFIRSDGFRKRFSKTTPELIYAAISAHCTNRRRGPVLEAMHIFMDDDGCAHEFKIESFSNTYDLLTMGTWIRLAPIVYPAPTLQRP